MSKPLTPQQLVTMRMGASSEMDMALDEIVRLDIMAEQLLTERDEAREAARKLVGFLPSNELTGWAVDTWTWLEEEG